MFSLMLSVSYPLLLLLLLIPIHSTLACGNRNCLRVFDRNSNQTIQIEAWGPDALRVRAIPFGHTIRDDLISALLPVLNDEYKEICPCLTQTLTVGSSVSNGNLQADITSDGKIRFSRVSDSFVLFEEKFVRSFSPFVPTYQIIENSSSIFPSLFSLNLTFNDYDGERMYGLGQHGGVWNKATTTLDSRNHSFEFVPHNTEITIPVMHSSREYSILFNIPSFGRFCSSNWRCRSMTKWESDACVQLDIWVSTISATSSTMPKRSTQSSWAELLSKYTLVTGRSPVYPNFTTGLWQSKNRYRNQSEVVSIVQGYLDRGLPPPSIIVIDFYSWAPNPVGDDIFNSACWPDPQAMVRQLRSMGTEIMLSPYFNFISQNSKYFNQASQEKLFALDGKTGSPAAVGFGSTYIYDVFQSTARSFLMKNAILGYKTGSPDGIRHWWLDCNEPCGDNDAIANLTYSYKNVTWPAEALGAAYPFMLNQAVREGMLTTESNVTNVTVILGRSAWAGSQRFGAAVWSGDTTSDFRNLQNQFRAGLTMAMSGIGYWCTDIGGYAIRDGTNTTDPLFRELLVRWFQWGAFLPLFRVHGHRIPVETTDKTCGRSGGPNEPWSFGTEVSHAIQKVILLRHSLRTYIHQQYVSLSITGTPIIRPLFFDFPSDKNVSTIDDQMMFGPDYLVAPQLFHGRSNRSVYLPVIGDHWRWRYIFASNYEHGHMDYKSIQEQFVIDYPGGQTVVMQTPLDEFPVFKRIQVDDRKNND